MKTVIFAILAVISLSSQASSDSFRRVGCSIEATQKVAPQSYVNKIVLRENLDLFQCIVAAGDFSMQYKNVNIGIKDQNLFVAGNLRIRKFPAVTPGPSCQLEVFAKVKPGVFSTWIKDDTELNAIECIVRAYDFSLRYQKVNIFINDPVLKMDGSLYIRQ